MKLGMGQDFDREWAELQWWVQYGAWVSWTPAALFVLVFLCAGCKRLGLL